MCTNYHKKRKNIKFLLFCEKCKEKEKEKEMRKQSLLSRAIAAGLACALVMTSSPIDASAAKKPKWKKAAASIVVGKSVTFKVANVPSGGKVTFSSSKKKIATVTKKGKVTAKKIGKTVIKAVIKNKKKKVVKTLKKNLTVKAAKGANQQPTQAPVATATASPAAVVPTQAPAQASAAAGTQASNAPTGNPIVDGQGSEAPTNTNGPAGTNGPAASDAVTPTEGTSTEATQNPDEPTVTPGSTPGINQGGLKLNANSLSLTVGGTSKLTVELNDESLKGSDVTWRSSNENVATVINGTVTAMGAGTATITAEISSDVYATCVVTVEEKSNEFTDGVTIAVANSLKEHENTVFTGTNADIRVRVYKDGQPQGNVQVTLQMEYKSGDGDFWRITNENGTATTNNEGIASFTVALKDAHSKYKANDDIVGGYLLKATATGANTTSVAPLTFATLDVGDITVNNLLTNLEQGENANKKGLDDTYTTYRRMIDTDTSDGDDSKVIGSSEYVISQQVSKTDDTDHAVTFNAAPMIKYPEVITGTDNQDYSKNVGYASGRYTVYDTSKVVYVPEVPINLNYLTLHFDNALVSANTALKIDIFDGNMYDVATETVIGSPVKTYAITELESDDNAFGYQIPIQEFAEKVKGDTICIKVYIESKGQINIDDAVGFSLNRITGNYVNTSKYQELEAIYKSASIEWKVVEEGDASQDPYGCHNYQSLIKMDQDTAMAYGIDTKSDDSPYFQAEVKYKVPTYPHVGNAIVEVKKNGIEGDEITYFMIPTEAVKNENKLVSSENVQAFRVTVAEAKKYEGTIIDQTDRTITVNSEKSGITEIYGELKLSNDAGNALSCLTVEEKRMFAYVDWAPTPDEEKDVKDFYALLGQTITVDIEVTDNGGNKKSNETVELYLGEGTEKLDAEELKKKNGVTMSGDATRFDEQKATVTTNENGEASVTFKSTTFTGAVELLHASCKGYNVKLSVAGTEAEYIDLYWITPGLSFIDQTEVAEGESKSDIVQEETKTVAYEDSNSEVTVDTTLNKKVGTNWLFGYQVVGLTKNSLYSDTASATANGFSNVVVSGVAVNIDLSNKLGTEPVGQNVKTNKDNATIQVTSTKTGDDVIKGFINGKTIDTEKVIYFTILDEAGNVVKTVPNVGKGTTSVRAGLNIPVSWKEEAMKYNIELPSGNTFTTDVDEQTAYIHVYDKFNNPLDEFEVSYNVTANTTKDVVIETTTGHAVNGYLAVKLPTPSEPCTYDIEAHITGYKGISATVNYIERNTTTKDFAMCKAVVRGEVITIDLSDVANEDTVSKDMFRVEGQNPYEIESAEISADGRQLIITLTEKVKEADSYVNISYRAIAEDFANNASILAKSFVSSEESAVIMKDGFTISAYRDAVPQIKVDEATGTVSGKTENDKLLDGTYVIFEYGTTIDFVKVEDGTATNSAVVDYEGSYMVYTGKNYSKVEK